jgi:hypothetical protein
MYETTVGDSQGTKELMGIVKIPAYPSGAPEFIPGFQWGSCYSIFSFMCMFCRSLFVLSSFVCWPLCFLFYRFWLPLWCLQTLICITCLMHDIVVSTFIFRCLILPAKSSQFGKPNILKQFPTVVSYLDYPHQFFRTLTIPNSSFIPWLSRTVLSYLDYPHQGLYVAVVNGACDSSVITFRICKVGNNCWG